MKLLTFCVNLFKKKDPIKDKVIISTEASQEQVYEYHNPWLSIRH
ncbi:MAG: hypothetical protein AAFV95_16855 [Bacteroidota bacterium]